MNRKVLRYMRGHSMTRPGDLVLCAVSGGADSMAMLCIMMELAEILKIRLAAAHFNHKLRGAESDRDEAFVADFCKRKNLELFRGEADVRSLSGGSGIEDTARRLRYAFLEETSSRLEAGGGRNRAQSDSQYGGVKIATAHTADDNMETVVMNLTRGAGLRGLRGIPPVRVNIIRPLLCLTRGDVEAYLAEIGVSYVTDSTNFDEAYTRNRIRAAVVPVLKSVNPRIAESVSETAALLRRDNDCLDALAQDAARQVRFGREGALIPAETLRGLHPAIASRLILAVLRRIGAPNVGYAHVEAVMDLASCENPSARADLPGSICARRIYNGLFIGVRERTSGFAPVTLDLSGRTIISETGVKIFCKNIKKSEKNINSLDTFFVRCDMICGKVVARPRQAGDRLILKSGGRSVKKRMIDQKIPVHLRQILPVIADDDGVIAAAGLGISEPYAAADGQEALCIKVSFAEEWSFL